MSETESARYRRAAAACWTFICMSGFTMTVVVAAGWGIFPALALMFMTCLTAGMMATSFSLIERTRGLAAAPAPRDAQ